MQSETAWLLQAGGYSWSSSRLGALIYLVWLKEEQFVRHLLAEESQLCAIK